MLVYDTKEQVIEKIKRHMDILAPGGGFIFDLGDTIETTAKPENVETMFEAVRTFGKY
jgi:uroporphyrinogen-III decarboxylase